MATPKWNKSRGLWVIQGQKNGIKKTFYSSTAGRKGMNEVLEKYNDWVEFGGVNQKMTVAKCVELYLADIESRLGKKDTYIRTESYSRLYILPVLGKARINNLSLREWQAILNEARPHKRNVKSLSAKSLMNLREVIVGLHRFAYRNYYCGDWRGNLYIPQGHFKNEKEILQPSDIRKLFEDSDIWYINAFRIMLLCGLRPGEALSLQKTDIGKGVLHISRSVNSHGEVTNGKNNNARRTVPLPSIAEALIRETIQRNENLGLHSKWVFCNMCGSMPSQSTMRKQWNRLKRQKHISGTPYSLRHTFVSIVSSQTHLAEGTLKSLIGHSDSMDTYGTYKHTVNGEMEQAADIINLTFERLKAENT